MMPISSGSCVACFDLGDLFEREPFFCRGAHDGIGLVGIERPIGPSHCGEGEVNVATQSGFAHDTTLSVRRQICLYFDWAQSSADGGPPGVLSWVTTSPTNA